MPGNVTIELYLVIFPFIMLFQTVIISIFCQIFDQLWMGIWVNFVK